MTGSRAPARRRAHGSILSQNSRQRAAGSSGDFAEDGDFAAAGSSNINYVNQLDRPIVSAGGGGQGWGRIFAAASPRVGEGYLLAALEAARNDGPWELPDSLEKLNAILRYSRGDARNGLSLTSSRRQFERRVSPSGAVTPVRPGTT